VAARYVRAPPRHAAKGQLAVSPPPESARDEDAPTRSDNEQAVPGDLLLVGRVIKAHATGGEVKVLPETDDPVHFEGLDTLHLGRAPAQSTPHAVESVRHQTTKRGPLVLVKFAGVDDRNAAETLRRQQVYVAEDQLQPLSEDESFIHDLVGLSVEREDGAVLGTVGSVEQTRAHDIFVVVRADGRPGQEPAMIPAVEEFVREVDLENGRLVVRPIEGMF
jgi:16S rRNA processing protein RimM